MNDPLQRRRDVEEDLDLALQVVGIAERLAMRRFLDGTLHVSRKPDGTPVSDADMAVEQTVRRQLEVLRPEEGVLGEEFGASGAHRVRWIIDPIDGTMNYIRQDPNWAVLLALQVGSRVTVGVVSAPALGRRWWAARGLGAYTDPGRVLNVNRGVDRDGARLTPRAARELRKLTAGNPLLHTLRGARTARCEDLFWSELLVAEGAAEIDISLGGKIWDLAARSVIVEEAGGVLSDVQGRPGPGGGSSLTAPAMLHSTIAKALRRPLDQARPLVEAAGL